MGDKTDIFDRIMSMRMFKFAYPFYKKHKAVLLYLLFGGLSFFLNIGLFILINTTGLHELINNVICWVVCVLFQFATNRIWVFESKSKQINFMALTQAYIPWTFFFFFPGLLNKALRSRS